MHSTNTTENTGLEKRQGKLGPTDFIWGNNIPRIDQQEHLNVILG